MKNLRDEDELEFANKFSTALLFIYTRGERRNWRFDGDYTSLFCFLGNLNF